MKNLLAISLFLHSRSVNKQLLRVKNNFWKCYQEKCFSIARVNFTSPTKLSYFHNPSKTAFLVETIGQLVDKAAKIYGTNDAVIICKSNLRKNFLQLKQDVDKFAAGLLALGLKYQDRIGIWSPTKYEWIVTQFSAAKAGLILVNINPAYQARELEYCVKKVGIRAIVSAEAFLNENYYDKIMSIIPSVNAGLENDSKFLTNVIMISEKEHKGAVRFWDVPNHANETHFKQLQEMQDIIQFDDPVNIQFTSGTTGSPKGATLTHFNIINNSNFVGKRLGYDNKTRIAICVPLYHCFGCVLGSLATIIHGACGVFPSSGFSAQATAEAIHKEMCTSVYVTPTMLIDLLNLPNVDRYNFSSIKTGVIGGATCSIEVFNKAAEKLSMNKIMIGYGTTETSPAITLCSPSDNIEQRATTIGTVLDHAEIKLINPKTRHIVSYGEPGELWVRGYLVMKGYWNDEEKTKEAITASRWYRTGDLAVADASGYVKIIGREKDVIIRGGENIYPREIEEFLHTHPKIVEVVGVPDRRLGEEVCAWVKLKANEDLSSQDLKDFCKNELAYFKIPRYVKFVDSFPTTITGKIQKFVIREKATEELNLK